MTATQHGVGPIGGQALLEGVMMRCGERWGAAVRRPDGSIATTSRSLPPGLARWRPIPLLRGVLALFESAALGTRAMVWAASERSEGEEDGYSRSGLMISTVVAVVFGVSVFGVLPALVTKVLGVDGALAFNLVEGGIRLVILVGYLLLLSMSPQVRRVFAFHGAEHMTIHAFEHQTPLEPEAIRSFDRRHPRCGTSFLLLVVVITVFAQVFVGAPGWALLVASRILLLPVVAGVSYEVIRFAGRHQEAWYGRILMTPGFWLQGLTTREPDDDQIAIAVAALQATLAPATDPVVPPADGPAGNLAVEKFGERLPAVLVSAERAGVSARVRA